MLFVHGSRPKCSGIRVPKKVHRAWRNKPGQVQVIGQAEIISVQIAKLTWPDQLSGRRVIFFLDNDAASIGLVRAYSPVHASLKIIAQSAALDWQLAIHPWYARVPTAVNPADAPSRLEVSGFLESLCAECIKSVVPDWWNL